MLTGLRRRLNWRERWKRLRRVVAGLAAPGSADYLRFERNRWTADAEFAVRPRRVPHPLWVRRDSTDGEVFRQVFIEREYSCLDDLQDVRLVIDCGANVGYSSAYFLSRHSRCEVIAVEPDAGNFAMLERNLAPYGDRVRCVRAGVWSHSAPLKMAETKYRDGGAWARQVRPCEAGEAADFQGIDVGSLLATSGHERIGILKIDVEGAEAVIFADNYQSWLDKVDALAIELHDDSMFGQGSEVFFAAIAGRGFTISRSGDLTLCHRPTQQ